MSRFAESEEGLAFIASAESRETSPEIMQAIAFFARDAEEAETVWQGDGFGVVCLRTDLWERVTGNGNRPAEDFVWGAAGAGWWKSMQVDAYVEAICEAGCGTFSHRDAARLFAEGVTAAEAAKRLNADLDEERTAPLPYDPLDHDHSMNA